MGNDSTARLPVFGKVDTSNEILLNAIATGYDALNNKMLTYQTGVFDNTTLSKINSRFGILRMLCRKYSPDEIPVVDRIYTIVVNHFKGKISYFKAMSLLNDISFKYTQNPNSFNIAALHIDNAEQVYSPKPFGIDMFMFLDNNKDLKRKKERK